MGARAQARSLGPKLPISLRLESGTWAGILTAFPGLAKPACPSKLFPDYCREIAVILIDAGRGSECNRLFATVITFGN